MVILRQFLALPQKPLASLRYFCLLKPAITNILIQMQIEDNYDIQKLIQKVETFDWKDILQSDIGNPPQNKYYQFEPSQKNEKWYKLFRGMLQKEEISQRSYVLTSLILKIKQNNYYALMLRKDYFLSLEIDKQMLVEEIRFMNYLLSINPKEYQFWVYKKHIFQQFKNVNTGEYNFFQLEGQFLDQLLEEDSKNYHVWDYKLWLCIHFGKEKEQLQSTEIKIFRCGEVKKMIEEQLKGSAMNVFVINWQNCYSLWSYRHNLIKHVFEGKQEEQRVKFLKEEIGRVKQWIVDPKNISNQCAWNYMTGTLLAYESTTKTQLNEFLQFSSNIFDNNKTNRFAGNSCLQLLLHLEQTYPKEYSQKLAQTIQTLKEIDPVRQLYYDYLLSSE